jgi:hypothetical protein
VITRAQALQAALAVSEQLLAKLHDGELDDLEIRTLLARRREIVSGCADTPLAADERALVQQILELDARIVAACEERRRAIAPALARVRQHAPRSAPGRVLTDLA